MAAIATARLLCHAPAVQVIDDFASASERQVLLDWIEAVDQGEREALHVSRDETGTAFELDLGDEPAAAALAERMAAAVGLPLVGSVSPSLRMRRYVTGQHHPRHSDDYEIDGCRLAATALLVLQAPEQGGETLFPEGVPGPLCVRHREGRLVAWLNRTPDGETDLAAEHLALPVTRGVKATATLFLYVPADLPRPTWHLPEAPATERLAAHRATPQDAGTALRGLGRRLVLVDDEVPTETLLALRTAADVRGLACTILDAPTFDYAESRRLRAGDLLYCPAVSPAAGRVEQFVWSAGTADLYRRPGGVFFTYTNSSLLFERCGLPVARTYWPTAQALYRLPHWVEELGGLPVVVKLLGFSGGKGVIRVDSLVTLRSLLGALLAQGSAPMLCAYVPDARHWRVFVVGDRAVGGYLNPLDPDDFRSSASEDPADYAVEIPAEVQDLAVRAAQALDVELAGVDVLTHASGRHYLLEANFPCYFGHAQENGQDIAGAIVDHLLDKALQRPS
ncbi:MAG: 2OG-Fe(II) oxygenase [Deltaproteobacteria bacterium]|nr:2OG-Fe(II) oxygenase [Deltaproteobacteria bacterium]